VTNYELTARARSNNLTVVSFNATTFHDRDRVLQGVFAAARDMTELKQFEAALKAKNAELEDASRMKSEFLANMSHELRTPLNAIIGFSEVLKDGLMGDLTDQQRGFIGDIFSSGKHLLSLINDILDLSKVEAGKMLLDLEPVQVGSLLSNSLSIIREKAAARSVRLRTVVSEGIPTFDADARKVKQIVYNLLSNAVKFTPVGGEITLRASVVPRDQVGIVNGPWAGRGSPLAESAFDEFLELEVVDTGIGISVEALPMLFQPFSQIDSGLARRFEGTGLGLALVKLLAELHGGTVAVESAVGEGSSFTVWIPLRSGAAAIDAAGFPPPSEVESRATPSPAVPPAGTIALVVESDVKSADLIRVQLEAEGFHVLHADSGATALRLAREHAVSLVTVELMLPDMDGWELLTQLKAMPELARVPVVVVSIVADRNRGLALGAAAVLQKPISRKELVDSLLTLGLLPLIDGRPLRVLVVDDDPAAVELVAIRLKNVVTSVERAYSGREALRAVESRIPDVIVLDLMMPDGDGFEVVEALRKNPRTARVPIIVMTAMCVSAEDRAKLNGYVTSVLGKTELELEQFTTEVRRAVAGGRKITHP